MHARWLRIAGWFVRAAVLLVVFVLAAYFAFNFWVRRGVTPVPQLTGQNQEEARQILAADGLVLRLADAGQWSSMIELGRVIESRPAAGTFVKRGAEIEVVMSLGTRRIPVPDLTGKALAAARLTLEGNALTLGPTLSIITARGPAGSIVAQDPAPGAEVPADAPVTLLVALDRSPEAWVMPDLVSRRYELVRSELESRGFRFGTVTYEPYEGVPAGAILRQRPLPGYPLRRDDAIALVVAAAGEGTAP